MNGEHLLSPGEPEPLRYQASFDGLRAVAVLAVLAYHAGMPWAVGGYLGVDVFFVLSGFLITTLLGQEWQHTGTIRIVQFYVRRALRLLPALLLLVIVLNVYSLWFVFPAQVAELRRETLATLLYAANWALVLGLMDPIGFFSHAWSLAIEEQFYIVWPLAFGAMLARLSKTGVLAAIAAAAAASAVVRVVLWQGPESFSRVYHGSDARAEALLIGCVLALLIQWKRLPRRFASGPLLPAAATAAAGCLLLMISRLELTQPFTLQGGLTLAALASALVIAEIRLRPAGTIARVLALPPLVGIGRISYGLYLWHLPVFIVYSPRFMEISETRVTLLRFALTFAAAVLSFFLVERPFLRWKRRWSSEPGR